jgi:3'-5' exoribonuclease
VVEGYNAQQFIPVIYDKEAYWGAALSILKANLSEKGMGVLEELLLKNQELVERFKTEFSASNHHDNCLSGLLAHSYKMLVMLNTMLPMYKSVLAEDGENPDDRKDLLYIGTFLHDIGKTKEMEYGVYTQNSAVSHRFFGAELVAEHKESIIGVYNEKWYYELCSIMLEHHGEFADPCRTWAAMIVHWLDVFESRMQGFIQQKEKQVNEDSTGRYVWFDECRLAL